MTGRNLLPIAIPFAIGVVFLATTVVSLASTLAFLGGGVTTQASFVGSKMRSGGNHGGVFLYPRFSFQARDGRTVVFTSGGGSTDQPYADGQRVTVVYDPARPEHAALYTLWALWTRTLVLAVFALPFTAMPAVIFVLMGRRRSLG